MTTPYVDLNTLFTPSSGGVPTVAYMAALRTNMETLAKPPGCKVSRTASQALTTGTFTNISFTAADTRDTDAFHDTSTNPDRLIVPAGLGGLYAISCDAAFAANATGIRQLFIQINGTITQHSVQQPSNSAGVDTTLMIYDEIQLSAGDYINFLCIQTSGGNLNITSAYATMTWRGVS